MKLTFRGIFSKWYLKRSIQGNYNPWKWLTVTLKLLLVFRYLRFLSECENNSLFTLHALQIKLKVCSQVVLETLLENIQNIQNSEQFAAAGYILELGIFIRSFLINYQIVTSK